MAFTLDECNLCPRMCGANRLAGKRGICGAPVEMVVARAALHFWEEPPLSGESGSGAVFFAYCPLRCAYCQNSTIAAGKVGKVVSSEKLADICLDLQAQGALNINFVTPTHYTPQIAESVGLARDKGLGLPIVWNTSGYERAEVVRALSQTVDVYLADYKYADSALAKRYSHAPDYPETALAAIRAMVDVAGSPAFDSVKGAPRMTGGVIVRHLMLPGALEQSKRAVARLYGEFGDSVLYSIMNQYTPVLRDDLAARFPELAVPVPSREYEELLDYADALGIDDYFWQDGPAAEESFIPAWDLTGVS